MTANKYEESYMSFKPKFPFRQFAVTLAAFLLVMLTLALLNTLSLQVTLIFSTIGALGIITAFYIPFLAIKKSTQTKQRDASP